MYIFDFLLSSVNIIFVYNSLCKLKTLKEKLGNRQYMYPPKNFETRYA